MQEVSYFVWNLSTYLEGSVFLSIQYAILTILALFTVLKNTLLSHIVIFPNRITVSQLRPNEIPFLFQVIRTCAFGSWLSNILSSYLKLSMSLSASLDWCLGTASICKGSWTTTCISDDYLFGIVQNEIKGRWWEMKLQQEKKPPESYKKNSRKAINRTDNLPCFS